MPWEKSSDALIEAFLAALPDDPRAERRKMFGYPCCFTQGQMFTGLHEQNLVVRLDEPQRAELLALRGARPFVPMPGRPMKEYVALPPAVLADPNTLRRWIERAFAYALSLPPREARAKKPAARKTPRQAPSTTPKAGSGRAKAR